jgi:hypothetical protein
LLPAVTVNISSIAPLPQRLSQNGSDVVVNGKQAMLFRPVIHLFGRKNRTLNGEVRLLHLFRNSSIMQLISKLSHVSI